LEGISHISGIHGRILMKVITITHYQVHMLWWYFQSHGFEVQGRRQRFPNKKLKSRKETVRLLRGSVLAKI